MFYTTVLSFQFLSFHFYLKQFSSFYFLCWIKLAVCLPVFRCKLLTYRDVHQAWKWPLTVGQTHCVLYNVHYSIIVGVLIQSVDNTAFILGTSKHATNYTTDNCKTQRYISVRHSRITAIRVAKTFCRNLQHMMPSLALILQYFAQHLINGQPDTELYAADMQQPRHNSNTVF